MSTKYFAAGIPEVLWYGPYKDSLAVVMPYLGENMETQMARYNDTMPLQLVIRTAVTSLIIIAKIHTR